MDEHEDLRHRLREMGEQPVAPSLQSSHLPAIAQLSAPSRSLGSKVRLAGVSSRSMRAAMAACTVAGTLTSATSARQR